jgi:hypothetical protein
MTGLHSGDGQSERRGEKARPENVRQNATQVSPKKVPSRMPVFQLSMIDVLQVTCKNMVALK